MNKLENYFNEEQTKQELNHLSILDPKNTKQKYGR